MLVTIAKLRLIALADRRHAVCSADPEVERCTSCGFLRICSIMSLLQRMLRSCNLVLLIGQIYFWSIEILKSNPRPQATQPHRARQVHFTKPISHRRAYCGSAAIPEYRRPTPQPAPGLARLARLEDQRQQRPTRGGRRSVGGRDITTDKALVRSGGTAGTATH